MGVYRPVTECVMGFAAVPVIPLVEPASISISSPSLAAELSDLDKPAVQLAIAGPVASQITTPSGGQEESNLKTIAKGTAWEDQDITTLARIILPSRGGILQADINGTATLNVYDLTSDSPDVAVITTSSIAGTSILFDAYQLSSHWVADSIGYNFKHTHNTAAGKLEGGRVYRFEYVFDTDNDGLVYVVSEIAVQSLYST